MANVVRKLVRGAKLKIRQGRKAAKTSKLMDAGERLLAQRDYELIKVEDIAREAGCSVGAFYDRFPDKNAFLHFIISTTFDSAASSAAQNLVPSRHKESLKGLSRQIVEHVARHLFTRRAQGLVRAATKLSPTLPPAGQALLHYRETVTDRAIKLLKPKLEYRGAERAIKIAVQIIFATIIDSILYRTGPIEPGSERAITTITEFIVGYLGRENYESEPDFDEENDSENSQSQNVSAAAEDKDKPDIAIIDPDIRDRVGTLKRSKKLARRSRGRKTRIAAAQNSTPATTAPAKIKEPTPTNESAVPRRKPKIRVI